MTTKTDSSITSTMISDEESAQQLGLKHHLKHKEIKTLIDYYKRKDPNNKGLLPHQIKQAASDFISSGLTVDPTIVFNIFDSAKAGAHRVTIREFVLGYAILSKGTSESRLRYLFSLFGANRHSTLDNDSLSDFLTRDQLVQCLKFLQRVVSEVSESSSDEDSNSDENDTNIHHVADNLISETSNPKSHNISYNEFIAQLKKSDVVMSMLDKLSNAAGEHLKYIEKLERDVAELHMEREGILTRSPSYAQDMDWMPAQATSKFLRQRTSADDSARLNISHVEKKRKIPIPRKQKIVRRDRLNKSPSYIDNNKCSLTKEKSRQHLQQLQQQLQLDHQMQKEEEQEDQKEASKQTVKLSNDSNDELDDDNEEINAAKPFLINYEQIQFGKILGRGACATVYEGTWMHIPVAVKVFNDGAGEAAGIERLATIDEEKRKAIVGDYAEEFWLLLQIRHPNCLLYMGICFEPYVCIVTELFSGGSIANYLHGPHAQKFSPSKAIEMISGVARGMFYLHASSPPILHRDLKASNILINRHATHCVICDFGLSKQFVSEASGRDLQGSQEHSGRRRSREEPGTIGTPYTMAPEVIEQEDYTPAADVYSFAIVMFEMCTGRYPFPRMKPIQLMFHVAQGKRPKFEDSDLVPPRLRSLIERCWAQNPKDRPSFEIILQELQSKNLEDELKLADKKWNESNGSIDKKIDEESDVKELSKLLPDVAFNGQTAELLKLINRGADVNYHDYDKRTALHVAAAEGHTECMRILINAGAKLVRDRWNNTAMADAMNYTNRTKDSAPVRLLRAYENSFSSKKNVDGVTESSKASNHDTIYRTYAAISAAQKGDINGLTQLLNNGLDVNSCDYDRRTPMMVAASEGKSDVVKLLLSHGANVLKRDRWGNTAYHEAERRGYHEIMRSIQNAEAREHPVSVARGPNRPQLKY